MARRIVEQSLIYISSIGGQPIDNFRNPIVYNSQPVITVSGGSGTGSLHFSVEPVDGACSVTSSGKVSFKYPGKSWVTIYKDGSDFTKTEQGKTIQCTYQRSKLLIVELEWKERQIIIKVANNQYIKVGDKVPAVNQSNYTVTGLLSGDTLAQNPELFFVYQSDDFYKFDVFTQTYSDDRYDNGIRYIKNNDGSWTVSGKATALSYYNLIISPTTLPDFFKPGRTFKLTIKEKVGDEYRTILNSPVRVYLGWYTADGKYTYNNYASAATIEVPKEIKSGDIIKGKAIGVMMKLRVENTTNLGSGRTFLFNMRYVDDRSIDNLHEGKYPIGARYAKAPNKVGYDQEIQYRSNKGQFRGLIVQNNKKYNLYLDYDQNSGKINADRYSGYPYTEITFFIDSKVDTTYESLEDTKYTIGVDPNQTIFDDFLYEPGTVVVRGNSNFHITSKYGNEYDYVPFQIIREEKSTFNGLNSGEYKFRMPINNCTLYCNFHTLNFDPDEESPYHPEWITGNPPYTDIYGPKSGAAHYQVEDKYWQGVVFCYFARQVYFGEDIPLMQGTSETTFYHVNPFNADTEYYLLRKDLITVVHRISHALRGTSPSIENVRKNPDESFYSHAESMNAPQARLFTYAGYPKSPKYLQKWHWVEKEVSVQDEIKYCMVSAESGANIRISPSTTATRIATYAQGTVVQILSVDSNGWAKIYKLGSTSESVYTSYKSLTPISTFEDVTLYKTTINDATIRTGPGTGYSVLDRLPNGSTVLVTTITSGWAKLNAAYKNGTRLDYSKKDGYVSSQYLRRTSDQEGITKKVKEKVYDVDSVFGSPIYSDEYDLDADGNIQYEDIQYTRYTGKFPSKPPDGTDRTIDWLLMSFESEHNNPYGANDDYLINYGNMPNIAWGSYIGVMNGYNEQEFGASCYATYQEAVTVLWRYARFRQFDIMGDGGYYMEIDDSDVAYWAQHGPWRWAISRGIFDGYRMQYRTGAGAWSPRTKAKPTDYINRAEWAYMVYKFCTMYAW